MSEKWKEYVRCDAARFSRIPARLCALPQWVCWRAEWKEERGKYAKVPLDPKTGREARSNNPATWGTFEEAVSCFNKDPALHGIGFVFSAQDPFTFVDLDDARDPKTGELGDWAAEIVNGLNSYTEVSPSGTGLRIIIDAEPVGSAKRRGKIEIYSFGQYATITGNAINELEIETRQGELADLYRMVFGGKEENQQAAPPATDPKLLRVRAISDDELVSKMTSAANGAKFLKLWNKEDVIDHSQADASLCTILAYWTRADAPRMDKLFRLSKLMRKKWDERRGVDTYGQRTINFAVKAATAMYDPDLDATIRQGQNDIANTETFVLLHGPKFVFNVENEEWFKWNCHRWEENSDLDMLFACEDVSKELLRRAAANPLPDAKLQQQAIKWATKAGDKTRRDAIENFARTRIKQHNNVFNKDLYLLACSNGIVDLRTGDMRDGQPSDWITRSTGIPYRPGTPCPVFDNFLHEVMCGDQEMVAYMWRMIGYSMTGDTTERAFFLFHGVGRNGKTTFVETLQAMLGADEGGYAQRARFSTFLKKNMTGGANDDVAHLSGARLVVASEADEKAPLDTAAIKELTGGDAIRARHLYASEFQFKPIFKLIMVTNHVPPIQESTHALWDRLHYVGFDYRVPDDKVDRGLRLKLMGELDGILARSVLACLEWQRDGLNPPEKVLKGRAKLESEHDTCGEFLRDMVEHGDADKCYVNHKQLYHAFTIWARDTGIHKPPSSKWLAHEMRNKKFTDRQREDGTSWLGLRLKAQAVRDMGEL
jgi:putative DNA primase/helicase